MKSRVVFTVFSLLMAVSAAGRNHEVCGQSASRGWACAAGVRSDSLERVGVSAACDTVSTAEAPAEDGKRGKKKKKKTMGERVMDAAMSHPLTATVGVAVTAHEVNRKTRKVLNARMERIRDSLNAVSGTNPGMAVDTFTMADSLGADVSSQIMAAEPGGALPGGCRKTSPADRSHCDDTGVCAACEGKKRFFVMTEQGTARFDDCTFCGATGVCAACGGKK